MKEAPKYTLFGIFVCLLLATPVMAKVSGDPDPVDEEPSHAGETKDPNLRDKAPPPAPTPMEKENLLEDSKKLSDEETKLSGDLIETPKPGDEESEKQREARVKGNAEVEGQLNEKRSAQFTALLEAMEKDGFDEAVKGLEEDDPLRALALGMKGLEFGKDSPISGLSDLTDDKFTDLIQRTIEGKEGGFEEIYSALAAKKAALQKKIEEAETPSPEMQQQLKALGLLQAHMQHQLSTRLPGLKDKVDTTDGTQLHGYNTLVDRSKGWQHSPYNPKQVERPAGLRDLKPGQREVIVRGYVPTKDGSPQKQASIRAVLDDKDGRTRATQDGKEFVVTYKDTKDVKVTPLPNITVSGDFGSKQFRSVSIKGQTYVVHGDPKNPQYTHHNFVDYLGSTFPPPSSRFSFAKAPEGYEPPSLAEIRPGGDDHALVDGDKGARASAVLAAEVASLPPGNGPGSRGERLAQLGLTEAEAQFRYSIHGPVLTVNSGNGSKIILEATNAKGEKVAVTDCVNCNGVENPSNVYAGILTPDSAPVRGDYPIFGTTGGTPLRSIPQSSPMALAVMPNVEPVAVQSRLLSQFRQPTTSAPTSQVTQAPAYDPGLRRTNPNTGNCPTCPFRR